jgi:hypothetical protein
MYNAKVCSGGKKSLSLVRAGVMKSRGPERQSRCADSGFGELHATNH